MPMQSHSGRGIIPWHRCDRCGWQYPASHLTRQIGLILCYECYDDPIAWQRPSIIQDILSFTANEELRVLDILTENQSDDITSLSS
jgi:hypothetical protein